MKTVFIMIGIYCGAEIPSIKPNICKGCGSEIPEDSMFCPFCGTAAETIAEYNVEEKKQTAVATMPQKNKKRPNLFLKIASAFLLVLTLALADLAIYQNNEINELTDRRSEFLNIEYRLKGEVSTLEKYEDYFNVIEQAASYDNIGYAAYNFHCDTGIIVVGRFDTDEKVTLTAYWSSGGTVSTDSSDTSVATISFDSHNWSQSTTLTVTPKGAGVSVVTFSNNVDNNTFKLIIIVQ